MRPHGIRLINRYAVFIVFVVAFSCDTFQEDFISDENKVVFGKTEFYTTPGVTVRILLDSLITHSFTNATLRVTQNPTKGVLNQTDGDTLLYTPHQSFTFGEDKFVISVQRGEEILKNQTITIFMPPVDFVRTWATYYGGGNYDIVNSITTDVSGNIYIAGTTSSPSGIATSGSHQEIFGGGYDQYGVNGDAYLAKFNADGVLQWGTYYGGNGADYGTSVAVDHTGNIYLAGYTRSSSGIATPGSHQVDYGGGHYDAYLVKFNTDGVRQWGTYVGGAGEFDMGYSVVVDAAANIYLTGYTESSTGIATPGSHQSLHGGGGGDAFLVKFNTDGVRQWATYYGGGGGDGGRSVALDAVGNVCITGSTGSKAGIATSGSHKNTISGNVDGGADDAFIAKFNPEGIRQWATYYGGSETDFGTSIAIDPSGNIYVAGTTHSESGIATSGSHQNKYGGGDVDTYGGYFDAFLVKFNSGGTRQWGTYYGGIGDDRGHSIKVDVFGNVYFSGQSNSPSGIASNPQGNADAYLGLFTSDGVQQWSTYYGGYETEGDCTIAIDVFGSVYITGLTYTDSGIATAGSHQVTIGGWPDGFLAKFINEIK